MKLQSKVKMNILNITTKKLKNAEQKISISSIKQYFMLHYMLGTAK